MSTTEHKHDNKHDNIFQELASIFSIRHKHSQILKIEILTPGLRPLLRDGCSVGITKKALVQAFVIARQIFLDKDVKQHGYGEENVLRSTEILILFAPEHVTACNWRKRRLIWILQSANTNDSDRNTATDRQDVLDILDRELTLTTTYLCSPLHRHTKSPTLWQHRFWVLGHILSIRDWTSALQELQKGDPGKVQSLLHSELSVVLCAGEQHPRNYYAFSYMRQLYSLLCLRGEIKDEDDGGISAALLDKTVSWCQANPRDISGWMFALYLLENVPEPDCRSVQVRIVNTVVRFALDIGWVGESLWTFVDMAVRRFGVNGVQVFLQVSEDDNSDVDAGLPVRSWKTWLGRAEKYWAVGVSGIKE